MDERLTGDQDTNYFLARDLIEAQGHDVTSIELISEGRSHINFDVTLRDDTPIIARFERKHRLSPVDGKRRDFHYNGILSLERERNLCSLVREEVGLPTPQIYGLYDTAEGPLLLVEKMPGSHWKDFIKNNNYSLEAYLKSLEFLGRDIAKVQRIRFNSFGDVMGRNHVYPGDITNFARRLEMITGLQIKRASFSGSLSGKDLKEVENYFQGNLDELVDTTKHHQEGPVLVLTDIHPMNFLVDEQGKPSGYIDLEFCQSGVPSLELYYLKLSMFNYFDEQTFKKAEKAFYIGFENSGGIYDKKDPTNLKLEETLSVSHFLAAATSYHGVSDGLRDDWSNKFKDIMFKTIKDESIDYMAVADVLRPKTMQPRQPSLY
jgi:hypothetical protein